MTVYVTGQELYPCGTKVLIVLCQSESVVRRVLDTKHRPSVTNETRVSGMADAGLRMIIHAPPSWFSVNDKSQLPNHILTPAVYELGFINYWGEILQSLKNSQVSDLGTFKFSAKLGG